MYQSQGTFRKQPIVPLLLEKIELSEFITNQVNLDFKFEFHWSKDLRWLVSDMPEILSIVIKLDRI